MDPLGAQNRHDLRLAQTHREKARRDWGGAARIGRLLEILEREHRDRLLGRFRGVDRLAARAKRAEEVDGSRDAQEADSERQSSGEGSTIAPDGCRCAG